MKSGSKMLGVQLRDGDNATGIVVQQQHIEKEHSRAFQASGELLAFDPWRAGWTQGGSVNDLEKLGLTLRR